jgi:DNA-binding transcriptional MerR regulator
MTYEEQIASVDSISYHHQPEMGEAAPHIRKSLRLLVLLRDAGVQLEDPAKLLEMYEAATKPQKQAYVQYQKFVDVYFEFCQSYINVDPVMDGRQGKAMREIIAYLINNCKAKDEAGALAAWLFILQKWENLTPYIRNQTTLAQIKKNLQEILTQLRNGNTKQEAGRRTSSAIRSRAKRSGKGRG